MLPEAALTSNRINQKSEADRAKRPCGPLDLSDGRYRQAPARKSRREPPPLDAFGLGSSGRFAADLHQVYKGEGVPEYSDPAEFFRRTYLTEGLKQLLGQAVERLSSKGGVPIVDLQTNFGGGKTHSLLALYHLFGGASASELAGVDQILKQTGVSEVPTAHRAVLVGTKIGPGRFMPSPMGPR